MIVLEAIFSFALLVGGIWLSAFFSGSETAFYRLSTLRVQVEAETGNRFAQRLLFFMQRPARFVATVLIGNNVANYVTTLAIGLVLALVVGSTSVTAEVMLTFAVAPIVFLCGELVPKNINYLTPLRSMLRKIRLFRIVYWIALPLSLPLVMLTHWLEKLVANPDRATSAVLGRPQIRDLISAGRLQGVMSDRQADLTNKLLRRGMLAVGERVQPLDFAFALPATSSREDVLAHANQFGLTHVPLHEEDRPSHWVGSAQISDLLTESGTPAELARSLPRFSAATTRLTAIQAIREAGSGYGIVVDEESPIGFVSQQSLVRPLFQAAPAIARTD